MLSILSATTTNKPGYTGPIDASTLPRYDRAFQSKNGVEDKEDADQHSSLEGAASDWHGSVIEDTEEC